MSPTFCLAGDTLYSAWDPGLGAGGCGGGGVVDHGRFLRLSRGNLCSCAVLTKQSCVEQDEERQRRARKTELKPISLK